MQGNQVEYRLRATELLLESVTDPSRLHLALQTMTELIGADAGILAGGRRSTANARGLITTNDHERSGSRQDDCFASFPLYRRWALGQPSGKLYSDADIARFARLEGHDIERQFPDASRIGARCMAHIDTGDDYVCYVGFARRGEALPFDESNIGATESLLPHLRHAYSMNRQFESLKAVSAAAMNRYERYHVGVVMVDEDGVMLYRNEVARQLFLHAEGLLLEADGRVVAQESGETNTLLDSIREHLSGNLPDSHFAPTLLKITRPGRDSPLSLAISPYRSGVDFVIGGRASGSAVIMIYDPERPQIEREAVVKQVYQLNQQEAQIVCALAAGDSLEDIARDTARSLEAVRSQLKRIFKKTGTSRQTELVTLVLSGPAAMVQ
ncbi:MAG: hypothetical protein IPH83_00820 [Gammaproteobacteria bacterium]|nr:hypothetical protein [Gammaproteobacteria bacterium]